MGDKNFVNENLTNSNVKLTVHLCCVKECPAVLLEIPQATFSSHMHFFR